MKKSKLKKPKLLYLDDEKANLTSFRYLFKPHFDIFLAETAEEAHKILAGHEIPVVISDQGMPGMTGIEFFEKISAENPEQIRILLTAYNELELFIQAVNKGNIYSYVVKPFDEKHLFNEIIKGFELYPLKKKKLIDKL